MLLLLKRLLNGYFGLLARPFDRSDVTVTYSVTAELSDEDATAFDWKMVGDDMWRALDKFRREIE